MLKNIASGYKSLFARAAKLGAPVTGVAGMLGDFGAPVGDYPFYLALLCVLIAAVAGLVWFMVRQVKHRRALVDGKITPEEFAHIVESNPWSLAFAFGCVGALVLGFICVLQGAVSEKDESGHERGIVATLVPSLEKVQNSLFDLNAKVDAIKEDTGAIRDTTKDIKTDTGVIKANTGKMVEGQDKLISGQDKIVQSLQDLSESFANAGKSGGLISKPVNPAEHYHNARIHELGGNFGGARQSYNEYLRGGLDYVDPWLNFVTLLKVQDGLAGAREAIDFFAKTQKVPGVKLAQALLQDKEKRVAELEKVATEVPECAPVHYLIAGEFSEEKLGAPTLADKKREKAALEKFEALDKEGKFVKWMLDKKEAANWQNSSRSRLGKLAAIAEEMLKNPFTLSITKTNQGTMIVFMLTEPGATELFYRLDGQGDFVSLGKMTEMDAQTGKPRPNLFVMVNSTAPGLHKVELKYTDSVGAMQGPFAREFDPEDENKQKSRQLLSTMIPWVSWRDYDGKTLVYFTNLLVYRAALKKIIYRIDGGAPKEHPLPPYTPGQGNEIMADMKIFITVPNASKEIKLKLTWFDGTESDEKAYSKGH